MTYFKWASNKLLAVFFHDGKWRSPAVTDSCGHDFDDYSLELMKYSQEMFFKLMRDTEQYHSDIYTQVTIYIPEAELSYIENYTGKDVVIRNLQEYTRLAAAISINGLKKELELGFELSLEEQGGRIMMTVNKKE